MVHLKNCKWLGTHNPVYPTNHCVLSHGSFLLSKWDANPSMCCYFKMVYLSKPFHGGFQPYNYFIIRGSGNKKIWFSQPFPQDSWSNKNYGEVSTSMLLLVCYLVGGWATPLKIWKSDWDDYSQYILENIMFETTNQKLFKPNKSLPGFTNMLARQKLLPVLCQYFGMQQLHLRPTNLQSEQKDNQITKVFRTRRKAKRAQNVKSDVSTSSFCWILTRHYVGEIHGIHPIRHDP